jgi:hypothetical protein
MGEVLLFDGFKTFCLSWQIKRTVTKWKTGRYDMKMLAVLSF